MKADRKLCKREKKEIAEHADEIASAVSRPKHICRACARVSRSKKHLCRPAKLPKGSKA